MARAALVLLAASGCRSLLGFEELADPANPDGSVTADVAFDGPPTPVPDGTPSDDSAGVACPATYTLTITGSQSTYRFVSNQAVPWLTANSRCVADGAHLIVLSDQAELTAINVIAGAGERWVGLSDRLTNASFLPVTDEPTTFPPASGAPWSAGEPSGNDKPCVAINDTGQLLTLACGNGRNFICECDGIPDDPANY